MGDEESVHPMDKWLTEEFTLDVPSAGEIREGWIVERRHNELLIDISAKSEGIIPSYEIDSLDSKLIDDLLVVGNKIPVLVVDPEDRNGNIILSYRQAAEETDWANILTAHNDQDPLDAEIIGFNKGGLVVQQRRGLRPGWDSPRRLRNAGAQRAPSRNWPRAQNRKQVTSSPRVPRVPNNGPRCRDVSSVDAVPLPWIPTGVSCVVRQNN